MKIGRIPDTAKFEQCVGCHNRARLSIEITRNYPVLYLCHHCGRYLAGVTMSRIGEAEQGIPIPKPGERINTQAARPRQVVTQRPRFADKDDDARGNR